MAEKASEKNKRSAETRGEAIDGELQKAGQFVPGRRLTGAEAEEELGTPEGPDAHRDSSQESRDPERGSNG